MVKSLIFSINQNKNTIINTFTFLINRKHYFDKGNLSESSNSNSFYIYSFNNQIYSYMTDKSEAHQTLNILSLIRLKSECKITPTRVDFSSQNKLGSTQTSITPAFNNDRLFYTTAFTIPTDMKHYLKNLHIQKCQFEEKIQRSLQESTNLGQNSTQEELIAVAPNSNYCQICQKPFEDYFVHIMHNSHVMRMSQSDGTQKIKALCLQFQATQRVGTVKAKNKLIKKQIKKEEKKVKGYKQNTSISQNASVTQGFTLLQNHSTGIIEDIQA